MKLDKGKQRYMNKQWGKIYKICQGYKVQHSYESSSEHSYEYGTSCLYIKKLLTSTSKTSIISQN